MFGVICAGRPVQTELTQVDSNKYVFVINDAVKINHLVVFLLPGAQLDSQLAASVYFQLPEKEFKLLGYISASKPSAIFRINSAANIPDGQTSHGDIDEMMMQDDNSTTIASFDINVGISIEPLDVVEKNVQQQKLASQQPKTILPPPSSIPSRPAPKDPSDIAALANKIVQHAYNFLGSFIGPDGRVPMKAFDDWWAKFKSRLASNPNFLNELSS